MNSPGNLHLTFIMIYLSQVKIEIDYLGKNKSVTELLSSKNLALHFLFKFHCYDIAVSVVVMSCVFSLRKLMM